MKKINIAKLLKDCPSGMELDCTMFDDVKFSHIQNDEAYPIVVTILDTDKEVFTAYGTWNDKPNAKCLIFPKGKTTWEGFVPPRKFKDGDIVISIQGDIHIYQNNVSSYCCLRGSFFDETITRLVKFNRLATEEEKQQLFDAIKANGYKWNPETKTLEELPKFKVGDKITDKNKFIYRITEITDKGYKLHDLKTTFITFEEADLYFVKVVDIFDINTLIPFESRVLVRSSYGDIWRPAIYGVIDSKKHYHYVVGGHYWIQCIPYEGNQHLLGKTDDCDEYFKTWE